mmetsp:Transcript_47467/g.152076  ORF Transcript_47467/g.152076 Transcript_47467/m.152076 type:complete len:338 (-) Transcript_47467:143-1156(-)
MSFLQSIRSRQSRRQSWPRRMATSSISFLHSEVNSASKRCPMRHSRARARPGCTPLQNFSLSLAHTVATRVMKRTSSASSTSRLKNSLLHFWVSLDLFMRRQRCAAPPPQPVPAQSVLRSSSQACARGRSSSTSSAISAWRVLTTLEHCSPSWDFLLLRQRNTSPLPAGMSGQRESISFWQAMTRGRSLRTSDPRSAQKARTSCLHAVVNLWVPVRRAKRCFFISLQRHRATGALMGVAPPAFSPAVFWMPWQCLLISNLQSPFSGTSPETNFSTVEFSRALPKTRTWRLLKFRRILRLALLKASPMPSPKSLPMRRSRMPISPGPMKAISAATLSF